MHLADSYYRQVSVEVGKNRGPSEDHASLMSPSHYI